MGMFSSVYLITRTFLDLKCLSNAYAIREKDV